MHNLTSLKITPHRASDLGWRHLTLERPDQYIGEPPASVGRSLINLVHLSDTHICDAQSPARVEFLDRYADPHHPLASKIGSLVGTYRAHEMLSTQVLESTLQRLDRLDRAPITKTSFDAVIFTGDLIDNAQVNELDWFSRLLSGSRVQPDSGDPKRWEGVGGEKYSEHYWNPHGSPRGEREDAPRRLYGFPIIPDLLDAVRAPFFASGLSIPWFAVHGNHDALLQGTVAPTANLRDIAKGSRKFEEISDLDALATLMRIREVGPAHYPSSDLASWFPATTDLARDFLSEIDFYQTLLSIKSHHPLPMPRLEQRYWSIDIKGVRLIAIDTVNPYGGWQGSIDKRQLDWLSDELASDLQTPTLIMSHHPVQDLFNTYRPEKAEERFGTQVLIDLISRHRNVVLWMAGHSHVNRIQHFDSPFGGFWQVETSSLIDWPQQGRMVEVFESNHGEISIATTMFDHCGSVAPDLSQLRLDDVHELAGLSRLLAVNDWQRRSGAFAITHNEGEAKDRNRILQVALG